VKILACDPGESFGYCGGNDNKLHFAGTVDMWEFAHALGTALGLTPDHVSPQPVDPEILRQLTGVEQVVVEDWMIYPWKAMELANDKCRTARVIGAVEFMCRTAGVPYVLQGANIKDTAQAAGVEELYLSPRTENRHANDAMQHYVFYNLGRKLPPVRWEKEGAPS
jgi:hypothetical protein